MASKNKLDRKKEIKTTNHLLGLLMLALSKTYDYPMQILTIIS